MRTISLTQNTQEKGSIAILTLIVMIFLLTIVVGIITLSSSEMLTAANYRDGIAAQYLAEAGVKLAIVELSNNHNWSSIVTNIESGVTSGSYKVDVVRTGNNLRVVSTGIVHKAQRNVVLHVTVVEETASLRIDYWSSH